MASSRREPTSDPSTPPSDGPEPNDEKMYTGEVVETVDGPVRPQQMNVGRDNEEGSGEFPSPSTPSRRADRDLHDDPA